MIEVKNASLYNADCFEIFPSIADKSIDMILSDLPYGTTRNSWDSVIPLDKLWVEYERVIKNNGAIVLFAQTPFDKVLGASNLKLLKYEWIWNKKRPTGFLNSKFAPMKQHENILVFSKASAAFVKNKSNSMIYNPQFRKGEPYTCKNGGQSKNYDFKNMKQIITVNDGNYYPISILEYEPETGYHPTQKPVALMEYLVKTYTNENDLVLDNCMGSGTTGVACQWAYRKFIGIEKEKKYYDFAIKRLSEVLF